jgi:hypothetical protein
MAPRLDPSVPRRQYVRDTPRSLPPFDGRRRPASASRPAPEPALGDDDVVRPDDVSIDEVVERLSRNISEAVNRAPLDERDELRTYASEIVREDTAPPGAEVRPPMRRAKLSFFAVAAWLAVAGGILAILMPPAGIVCFVMAGIAAVMAVILGPGDSAGARATGSDHPRVTPPPA